MSTPHIRDYQGKHIHMIGIGGSSMSGLAQMLLEKGYRLTGSDNLETYATRHLRDDLHIPVTIGHKAENVHGADLVVYTVAILPDNPDRRQSGFYRWQHPHRQKPHFFSRGLRVQRQLSAPAAHGGGGDEYRGRSSGFL